MRALYFHTIVTHNLLPTKAERLKRGSDPERQRPQAEGR